MEFNPISRFHIFSLGSHRARKNSRNGSNQSESSPFTGNSVWFAKKEYCIGKSSGKNIEGIFYHGWTGWRGFPGITGLVENDLQSTPTITSSEYYTCAAISMRGLITLDSSDN